MKRLPARVAVIGTLLASVACGDPLVDDRYRGEPIFVVEGRVESFTAPAGIRFEDFDILASLFWVTDLATPGALSEHSSVSAEVSFPATFELQIYQTPKAEQFLQLDGGAKLAFGAVLVYVDVDGSRRYDAGDRLIGGSDRTGVVYAEQEIPLESQQVDNYVPAGFSVGRLDAICGEAPPETEFEFSGAVCDLARMCPDAQRCLPVGRFCVAVEGPGVVRCSEETPCTSDRQVCHPERRICTQRQPLVDQVCRADESCGPGLACLEYFGCVLPVRPDPIHTCVRDPDCEPLGFICDPAFGICVPKEALGIHVPGAYDPALLTCSPTRG